jgi:branched-chain amino acid aminotransferase
MINYNGKLIQKSDLNPTLNRGFLYGDAVFETLRVINNQVLFLEDHYFRLMASMRILRMEIPMNFTMEFFEQEILSSITQIDSQKSYRVRVTVYRDSEGFYLPKKNEISYFIQSETLVSTNYQFNTDAYEIDLFKDFYITKHLLSTLKTNNKALQVTASIFATENGLDNCLLLNDAKNIVEAIQGNLFMVIAGKLITPPLSEGCLNGIMRKQIIRIAQKMKIELEERPISPFELQKADELFVTNTIQGIQPITKYKKTIYEAKIAKLLFDGLIQSINEIAIKSV